MSPQSRTEKFEKGFETHLKSSNVDSLSHTLDVAQTGNTGNKFEKPNARTTQKHV